MIKELRQIMCLLQPWKLNDFWLVKNHAQLVYLKQINTTFQLSLFQFTSTQFYFAFIFSLLKYKQNFVFIS